MDIKKLISDAEQGNAHALNDLGVAYMTGNDVKVDAEKAIWCFRKAAAQYHKAAIANLGICYAEGSGTEKDLKAAIGMFAIVLSQATIGELAGLEYYISEKIDVVELTDLADQGNAQAQFFLGMCYAEGKLLEQDSAKAWELYSKSAEQGEPLAQIMVGIYTAAGINVERDLFLAEKIIDRAVKRDAYVANKHASVIRDQIINETTYLLVKVTDKQWANSLLDGNIFMRALSCFSDFTRRTPDSDNSFRGDTLEGIASSFNDGYNPYGYSVKNGEIEKDSTIGIIDALTIRKKVYCMYCLEYDALKSRYNNPNPQLRDFGDTAIVITNAEEFFTRIEAALTAKYGDSYWWACKRVSYDVNLDENFTYDEFSKSPPYAWQNEFRISLDLSGGKFHPDVLEHVTGFARITFLNYSLGKIEEDTFEDSISDSLSLSIGDIRDICVAIPIDELLSLAHSIFNKDSISPYKFVGEYEEHTPRPTFIKGVRRVILDKNSGYYNLGFDAEWYRAAVI